MATKYARVTVTQTYDVDLSDVGITPEVVREFHSMDEWDQMDDHDIYQVVDARLTIEEAMEKGDLQDSVIEDIEVMEY